jgi:hypothetical protein
VEKEFSKATRKGTKGEPRPQHARYWPSKLAARRDKNSLVLPTYFLWVSFVSFPRTPLFVPGAPPEDIVICKYYPRGLASSRHQPMANHFAQSNAAETESCNAQYVSSD